MIIVFILSLSTLAGSIFSILLTIITGLLIYFFSYKFISKYQSSEVRDETNNLFRVIGILVSLMLSLAFADVIFKTRQIENAIQRETLAIADAFKAIDRFESEQSLEAKTILVEYIQAIIEDDWPALADDKLSQRTDVLGHRFFDNVLELEPITPVEKQLWSNILTDIDAISDHRMTRLEGALAKPPVYIHVTFLGFLITMVCFGSYKPQIPVIAIMLLYCIFIALVLYLILAMSDPFQGAFGIEPTVFETLLEKLEVELE